MKQKILAVTPALCFLVGFLGCIMLAPTGVTSMEEGSSCAMAIGNISFWDIFLNNAFMCVLFMAACGVGSSILILIQGVSFGGTYILWVLMGNAAKDFWLLFLPHVFFEFIAMSLAGYLGFRLLWFVLNKTGQTPRELFRDNRWILALTFAAVFVAALVECYVTPAVYHTFA